MMTPRQIIKLDPKLTSIDAYDETFAFLNLNNMPKDDEDRKQKYMMSYRFYVFLRSSILPVIASLVFASVSLILLTKGVLMHSAYLNIFALPIFGVWGSDRIHIHDNDLILYTAVCSSVSISWIIWLFWRIYRDVTDSSVFFSSDQNDDVNNLLIFGIVFFITSIIVYYLGSLDLANYPSIFVPSIYDNLYLLIFKKCLAISMAYWASGFSIILISVSLRHMLRKYQPDHVSGG